MSAPTVPSVPCAVQPFRDDLARLYHAMRPSTIAGINVTDLCSLPLDAFLSGTSRVWLVDWEAGRPEQALARQLVRTDDAGGHRCLASEQAAHGRMLCGAYLPILGSNVCARFATASDGPLRCNNFKLGSEPRVTVGDGSLGRAAYFATRVEEVVATASTPADAITRALVECRRAVRMDQGINISAGSIELVISVLPPLEHLDSPFHRFEAFMIRRFGAWTDSARARVIRDLVGLRNELFAAQIDAHARELFRLVDKHVGGVYFATHPVEPAADGSWSMWSGLALSFEILGQYFAFDFESFPAEAFLRRQPNDKRVVQATLLRPRSSPFARGSRPPRGSR